MWFTPSSIARRSTSVARSGSEPRRLAPKPIRLTTRSPRVHVRTGRTLSRLVCRSTRTRVRRPMTLGGKEVATMPATNRDRAVVLGGSIAGLIAARVLADAYEKVTIVERDVLPAGYDHRRGVPHGRHVHGLIPRGRMLLDELMPGLSDELVAAGGLPG